MFVSDRDLLVVEPNLFRDVVWVGQKLGESASATVAGTTLTMTGIDVDLDQSGVGAGHVAVVDGVGYEVIARLGIDSATISRVRLTDQDAVIVPSPVAGVRAFVMTFGPMMAVVHRRILLMLGIDPDGAVEDSLSESSIVNPKALRLVEVFGTLHMVYSAASVLGGPESSYGQRAEVYRRLFCQERGRVWVRMDIDGDGVADSTRRLNAAMLERG